MDWRRPPTGPGEVIDRRGQPPVTGPGGQAHPEGRISDPNRFSLHPFGPRLLRRRQDEEAAVAAEKRAAFPEGGLNPYGDKPTVDLDATLTGIFDRLSRQVAGGLRTDPRDLLPESADPLEGLVPDEFRPDVAGFDWFNPTVWAQADPNDISKVDLSKIQPLSGAGKDGKGMDWFRGGEAPNNLSNRANPLYQARREFAVQLAPQIEDLFEVSSQGSAGYLRPYNASHNAPGGPSGNSDHYSGGAIDFFGDPEELTRLRNWLVEQPFTSFVRWQSESHYDHVHVSFDLGYVAQNYFQGREIPSLTRASGSESPAISGAPEAARVSRSAGGVVQGGPRQGVQVADDPNANRVI